MSPLGAFLRGEATRPNAARALRITLARRLVETPGAPFVPTGEVFRDVASARDELGLLPAAQGPMIVRVRVEGGTASEREGLTGDWLIDPDGDERVARLPMPEWHYSDETRKWIRARPWLEAWETCPNGAWMLDAASEAHVDHKLVVLAACACARTALPFVRAGEERPLRAIETAERWSHGEGTFDEVRAASEAAWIARTGTGTRVADAAASAAGYVADHVAFSAASAAYASTAVANDGVNDAAHAAALARCADLVRGVIPTLVVLRAVARPV